MMYNSMNARYKWRNGSINKEIKGVYGDMCNGCPSKAHFWFVIFGQLKFFYTQQKDIEKLRNYTFYLFLEST
jgi:hypothetical protein